MISLTIPTILTIKMINNFYFKVFTFTLLLILLLEIACRNNIHYFYVLIYMCTRHVITSDSFLLFLSLTFFFFKLLKAKKVKRENCQINYYNHKTCMAK